MKKYLLKVFHSDTALARTQGIVIGLNIAGLMLTINKYFLGRT